MIRVADRSDLKCISSMWSLLDDEVSEVASYIRKESDYDHIINNFILDIIDSSSSIIILAEINGNIIGFSSGHVDKVPWLKGSSGLIGNCWVDKDYRIKGVGSKLVGAVEEWLKENKASSLEVVWDVVNSSSEKFWLSLNYHPKLIRGSKDFT